MKQMKKSDTFLLDLRIKFQYSLEESEGKYKNRGKSLNKRRKDIGLDTGLYSVNHLK